MCDEVIEQLLEQDSVHSFQLQLTAVTMRPGVPSRDAHTQLILIHIRRHVSNVLGHSSRFNSSGSMPLGTIVYSLPCEKKEARSDRVERAEPESLE
jgi:hypothetical protein